MSETQPINQAELLEKIQAGWDALQACIATLTPEQITIPTDAAGWTVKDHLMHLTVWQEGVWHMLEGRNRVEAMGVPQDVWETR
ncbi:MAG: maleylpyruvate isomerase N-terminal domain-containing protein, partial [Chloroflexota bacterium]